MTDPDTKPAPVLPGRRVVAVLEGPWAENPAGWRHMALIDRDGRLIAWTVSMPNNCHMSGGHFLFFAAGSWEHFPARSEFERERVALERRGQLPAGDLGPDSPGIRPDVLSMITGTQQEELDYARA